jgi:DNA-directed RNA polymerase subunit F
MPKKASIKPYSIKKNASKSVKSIGNSHAETLKNIRDIENLSRDELREILLVNTYKLALTRAQVDAVMEILIKKGITTYDEVWKKTNEIFKENKRE